MSALTKNSKELWRLRIPDGLIHAYQLLFGDMARVYSLLPGRLRVQVWVLFASMLVMATLEVLSISVLAFLGLSVAAPQATASQPGFSSLISLFPAITNLYADPIRFVLYVAIAVFLIFVGKNVFTVYVMWRVARIGELMSLHLGDAMLHRFLCSPYMWHISSDSTRTLSALGARDSMSNMLVQLLSMYVYSLTAVALFVALLSATPGIILSVIIATALIAVAIYNSLKHHVDRAGLCTMLSGQAQTKSLMDAFNGIREVLIYRQQNVFHQAYLKACLDSSKAKCFLGLAPPLPTWILECVGIGVIPLAIWLLSRQPGATLGTLASVISMVMLTAWRILPMVNRALSALIGVRSLRPVTMAALSVFEEMKRLPTVELPEPDPDFTFDTDIHFENISFRYPNSQQDALCGITLTIPKGSQVGFIGLSGAGKSTIVGILSGLMEPTKGHILVDSKPLGRPQLAAYMLRVGYVPQTPYIMPGSIADNVAFSHWGRKYDREQVKRACRMAALDLVEHGKGIDIVVGERGAGLSGGQAQRVSIARALFCNPDILILDESTSSLDQANESAIMETINSYRGIITTIIVAHRLTTLEHCDYLFLLDGGRLHDQGPAGPMLERYRTRMAQMRPNGTLEA